MAASKGHNNATGIISAIVLVFGIILSVVLSVLLMKAEKFLVKEVNKQMGDNYGSQFHSSDLDTNSFSYANAPIWSLGFAYIVPGLIGCLSAFIQKKAAYITHMVFSIITLVVMGIFFIVGILAMAGLAVSHPSQCTPLGEKCVCSPDDFSTPSPIDMSCDDIKSLYAMVVVIILVLVFAWILTLVSTILSGILACRHEPAGGVIIQRTPVTTTVVHSSRITGMEVAHPHVQYQPPPTQDNAKLVYNMEY
ncbi:uncharacterized protein LOC124256372 [Haliotis rubra]|uniref:uncharacterized protein LOC124256372 n=1 Tax=Haliotis rubra TaxID=36100 RepID=UPI001EE5F31B|nr:uncharacterized protein LOC124256372 [Haliotis rubra]